MIRLLGNSCRIHDCNSLLAWSARNALGLMRRRATRHAWLLLVSVPALSLDANALPGDISCNLRDEIAGRVIDIRFECARLRVAVLS